MAVLREVGDELAADEAFRPLILEPLQVLGVDDFGESQVTIKTMITTLPLKQWDVARELGRRIKKRFEQEGIEIPFPHLSLYFGEASKGSRRPGDPGMLRRGQGAGGGRPLPQHPQGQAGRGAGGRAGGPGGGAGRQPPHGAPRQGGPGGAPGARRRQGDGRPPTKRGRFPRPARGRGDGARGGGADGRYLPRGGAGAGARPAVLAGGGGGGTAPVRSPRLRRLGVQANRQAVIRLAALP